MLNFVLTLLGSIGVLILCIVAVAKHKKFFYVMLIVKPFIDITVNSTIVGGFNALELSAGLIFLVALFKYISLKGKSYLYNHAFVWFFILLQLLSYLTAFNSGEQTAMAGFKYFLRLFDSYFIYFVAAAELLGSDTTRKDIYRNIWYTTLIMGVITIFIYYSGLSNSDTTRGLVRYNGLYNDPGTPSYLAVISLLFMMLYTEVAPKASTPLSRILIYFTWAVSLFVLYITLTKSAILMFVVFILMWFGIFKRQFIFIVPALVLGGYLSFVNVAGLETRFETEVNFLESADSETAKSVGTGRVNRWETLLDEFNNRFDLPTKLLGSSRNYSAHNQYIAYLMQVGIFGLSVFIIFIFRFYKRIIEIYSKNKSPEMFAALTLLSMYCVYSFTGHPFDYTTLLWYLMILLANINVYNSEVRKARKAMLVKNNVESGKAFKAGRQPSLSI